MFPASNSEIEPIRLGQTTVTFLVDAEMSGGSATVCRCDVGAGMGMPVPHSQADFDETVFVLDGTVTMTVDGESVKLGPGQSLFIPRGAVHSFVAADGDVSVLLTSSPGLFGPQYFRDLQGVLGSGPPDPAAIADVMRRHGLEPQLPAR